MKGYEKTSRALSDMLRQDSDGDWDNHTPKKQLSLDTIKNKLASPAILALPKVNLPTMIDMDESNYAIGAVLRQQPDDDNPTKLDTFLNWSKKLREEDNTTTPQWGRHVTQWCG